MSALQHPTLARPPRCLQLPCRAEQASPAGSTHNAPSSSRRTALGAALLLPAGAVLAAARPAVADELAVASAAEAEAVVVPPVLDVISWPQWVDRNFSFSYPPGFKEVQDLSYAAPPRPRAGTDQVAENPLKAEVRGEGGQQRINVVVKQTTAFKRTLLQVTDISQLGDPRQVANLLLPPGAVVASVSAASVAQPPKDTGTLLGTIQRDPVSYYSYDVLLPDGTRVQLAAAAQLGRLYVLAASAPAGQWQEAGPALKEAAASFRLRYKV